MPSFPLLVFSQMPLRNQSWARLKPEAPCWRLLCVAETKNSTHHLLPPRVDPGCECALNQSLPRYTPFGLLEIFPALSFFLFLFFLLPLFFSLFAFLSLLFLSCFLLLLS